MVLLFYPTALSSRCSLPSFANAQANNQWNIAAELADDPMDSAFARALRGGIKGVAMVLDHEVQPLTRASTAQYLQK